MRTPVKIELHSERPMTPPGGTICGGDREAAEKYIAAAHCQKHKRLAKKCKTCMDIWLNRVDECFMAVM
jgi:hypothetical protein